MTALIAVAGATSVNATEVAYGAITETEPERITVVNRSDTEAVVREYFKDIPVLSEIARCESHFRHTLPDGTILKGKVDSADTGVMQINKRYHGKKAAELDLNLENLDDNLAYARYLYEKQGTKPWKASSACWSNTLAYND